MNILLLTRNTIASIVLIATTNAHAASIAYDDFESGGSSFWKFTPGPVDKGGEWASLSTGNNNTPGGTISLRIVFLANTNHAVDVPFDLGNTYKELSIKFDLYIPSNYTHQDRASKPDNNKLFRLWGSGGYNGLDKIGASTWLNSPADGFSSMAPDYKNSGGSVSSLNGGGKNNWVSASDLGKWMRVVLWMKLTDGVNPTYFRSYKNGALFNSNELPNQSYATTAGWTQGYLLGTANSQFVEDTTVYLDNVEFYDYDIMSKIPKPPTFISVE